MKKNFYFIFTLILSYLFSITTSYGQCTGTYATLPYVQNFDNTWTSDCDGTDPAGDVPSANWVNTQFGTLTSATPGWRRSDYTVWGATGYPAPFPTGSFGARFHTALTNGTGPTYSGNLDLYLDCSASPGTQQVTFYYINLSGLDSMGVHVSTDGGATFTGIGDYVTASTWTLETLTFASSSATTILRFTGTAVFGSNFDDPGMDDLNITTLVACSGAPTPGTVTASASGACATNSITLGLSGATVATGLTYQWQSSTDGSTYTPISGATNSTYTFTGQTVSTYYNCVVSCGGNSATSNNQYIVELPCYCVPTFIDQASYNFCAEWTSGVTGGGLNYTSNTCTPANPINQTATVQAGVPTTFTVTATDQDGGGDGLAVWVDFENAGTFGSADDLITSQYDNSGAATITFTVTMNLPVTTPSGTYRMRMINVEDANGTTNNVGNYGIGPCGAYSFWGSYEDFTLVVQGGATPPCDTVTNLAATGITQTGATINWTAVNGTAGYEVVVTTSAGIPVAGGGTANNSFPVTGLTANTPYYVLVRDSCGVGSFSAWDTILFTTSAAACDTVTGLAANGITQTNATINWTAVAGTAGYEIAVGTLPLTVIVPLTGLTANSYPLTGLTANTTYYVLVRDSCGVGNLSAWDTLAFTTPAAAVVCDTVTGLAANGITQTTATINWTVVAGTAGYEIAVGTLPLTVVVPLTGLTANSYPLTGLTANTTYYVIVRDSCGPGDFSAWDTLAFTTSPSTGIANINGSGQFSVDAYPNPVNDIVTVRVYGLKGNNGKVSLTDITGRTISTMDMATDRADMNMSNLAPGIYLLRYEDDAHTSIIKVNKQ